MNLSATSSQETLVAERDDEVHDDVGIIEHGAMSSKNAMQAYPPSYGESKKSAGDRGKKPERPNDNHDNGGRGGSGSGSGGGGGPGGEKSGDRDSISAPAGLGEPMIRVPVEIHPTGLRSSSRTSNRSKGRKRN